MHQPYYRYILPSVGLFGNVVPRRVALIHGERAGLWEAFWPATFAYHVARDPSLCDRRNSFGGFVLCVSAETQRKRNAKHALCVLYDEPSRNFVKIFFSKKRFSADFVK